METTVNEIIKLPNQKSNIDWTPYLAAAYAEGFCEGEDATKEEQLEAWACIISTKLYFNLQGWFGRTASSILQNGYIKPDGTIEWDLI